MIQFKECSISGYKARTIENASADVTIAIAKNFNTAGEVCTKNAVYAQRKIYVPINYWNDWTPMQIYEQFYYYSENKIMISPLIINIAGNGIYTLKEEQLRVDEIIYKFLNKFLSILNVPPILIRTGGQSGIDEAGAKAADKLGIPTLVLAPKGWIYRDINNKDIYGEESFKVRFQ